MKYRRKPTIIDAVKLEANERSIKEALEFLNGDKPVEIKPYSQDQDRFTDYCYMIYKEGLKLKTPESGGETQIASIGDYILRGESKDLGVHYWPVKPDYFEENYEKAE